MENVEHVLAKIKEVYLGSCPQVDEQDGLSFVFSEWRFNLRGSNTEPLLRLNLETKNDAVLLSQKTTEVSELIKKLSHEHQEN